MTLRAIKLFLIACLTHLKCTTKIVKVVDYFLVSNIIKSYNFALQQ